MNRRAPNLPTWKGFKFRLAHQLGLRPRYEFGVISRRPLILYTHYAPSLWKLLSDLARLELHLFINCRWSLEVDDQRDIALRLKQWMVGHPRHRIVHLAPSETEADVLRSLEIPVIVCSRNCLVDEAVFKPRQDQPKLHRALYDARLTPFKRHELAARVRDLALVTYDIPLHREESYIHRTRAVLAHATWLNGPFAQDPANRRPFNLAEVALHLSRARVGLILSALEGQNRASIQYLLGGLPVVTTRNRGGRDAFFSPEHVIWADDSPEAVAAAVDELIARDLDPDAVRARALRVVRHHREVLVGAVGEILARQPRERREEPDPSAIFQSDFMAWRSPVELLRLKLDLRLRPAPAP
jgi:hypothetical protein